MILRRARATLKALVKGPTPSTSRWLAHPYVHFKARSLLSAKLSTEVVSSAEEYLSSVDTTRSSAGFAGVADAVASMVVAQSLSIYDALDAFLAARSAALHRACQLLLNSTGGDAAALLASFARICDLLVESVCASWALFCGDDGGTAPLLHTLLASCFSQQEGLGRAMAEQIGEEHWTESLLSWIRTQTAAVRAASTVALQARPPACAAPPHADAAPAPSRASARVATAPRHPAPFALSLSPPLLYPLASPAFPVDPHPRPLVCLPPSFVLRRQHPRAARAQGVSSGRVLAEVEGGLQRIAAPESRPWAALAGAAGPAALVLAAPIRTRARQVCRPRLAAPAPPLRPPVNCLSESNRMGGPAPRLRQMRAHSQSGSSCAARCLAGLRAMPAPRPTHTCLLH
jgi:hypothetical protein